MKIFTILTVIMLSFPVQSSDAQSPYAGQESRSIKSLSDAAIQGYLAGSGMGYAKAAELNGYPGPKHVLELATELQLEEQQITRSQDIFRLMKDRAAELGRQLVEKERVLNQLFVTQSITPERLRSVVAEIASIEAELRYTHLQAHLQQKPVLKPVQLMHYDKLRGYGNGHTDGHRH